MTPKLLPPQTTDPDSLIKILSSLVHVLKENGMSEDELLSLYSGKDKTFDKDSIPVAIFSTSLSPSESICKYLRENAGLSYADIAKLINRDERSVWTSHHRSLEKNEQPFDKIDLASDATIPVSIFADRRLSILEHVVLYLSEKTTLTKYAIAKLLNKTPGSIYTIHNRAVSKMNR